MLQFNISKFRDNLVLTTLGDVWAYFRIEPDNISNNELENREKSKSRFRRVVDSLAKYHEIDFSVLPIDMNLDLRFKELSSDFGKENVDVGKYYAKETESILRRELRGIKTERFYFGVKLKQADYSDNMVQALKVSAHDVLTKVVGTLGFELQVEDRFFNAFKVASDEVESTLRGLGGVALTEDEMSYLIRHSYIRDIAHNYLEEQEKRDLYSMTDTVIKPQEAGYLQLNNEIGNSWVSFIPVGEMPDNIAYSHLFEVATTMKYPVELHFKTKFLETVGFNGLTSKLNRSKLRFKNNAQESALTGDVDSMMNVTNRLKAEELQTDIEQGHAIVDWLACFVVYGKTKVECKRNGDTLINRLSGRRIKAYRPNADQMRLFYDLLPGNGLPDNRNWIKTTNTEGLAECLYAVSNRVGNEVGWYIGRVIDVKESATLDQSILSSKKIVLFNPLVANQGLKKAKTASPHVAVTGETGKGKSFLVKMLFLYMSMMEMKTLYIDPKAEVRRWFKAVIEDETMRQKYPLYVKHLESFHYITLDATDSSNWGALDPLVFLSGSTAKDTAQAMIEQIYDVRERDSVQLAILQAIDKVMVLREQDKQVGMLQVIEELQVSNDDQIATAGNLLHEKVTNSILQLGFSNGQNASVSLDSQVNVLEISGLELPKEGDDPAYYSDIERKSICLMLALGKFCELFGSSEPDNYTCEIFDEAWIFNVSKNGKKILKQMKRVGRSQKNMLLYATQSVGDVSSDDDHGQFGVEFAFDEPSEREAILKHLDIEPTQSNQKELADMLTGQCMMRDVYGRRGKIAIHCLFEEMTQSFKTVNKTNSSSAEENYS